MANRLAGESSPYLLSHSENPVNWFPWGEEALESAGKENKPIFLSIGYSACHWCHVMERESFQNEETAEILNDHFVSIKVDREERPDLDSIYMDAVQVMKGNGGWPLSVFLLPDGIPFYGGTYFPSEEKAEIYGVESFPGVLRRVAAAFQTQRDRLQSYGCDLQKKLKLYPGSAGKTEPPGTDILESSLSFVTNAFDPVNGGFYGAPKFPQPMVLEFLLRYRKGGALEMAVKTLEKMAYGGIHDHLGGGFHRYSTDQRWLVPHFEKMLYDNALLARVYTEAFQITGKDVFRKTAEETLDFLLREMHRSGGGFFSALDADSISQSGRAEEGAFYTWDREEIMEILGSAGEEFCSVYNVADEGFFEGKNILHLLPGANISPVIEENRKTLLEARNKRPKPFKDSKIITSWNAMAIRAFAAASVPLHRTDYLDSAIQTAEFLLLKLRNSNGVLFRSWNRGRVSSPGFLEDYALLSRAFLQLYKATSDTVYVDEAKHLIERMESLFKNPSTGLFTQTGTHHRRLFMEPANPLDNAVPSGISSAVEVLKQFWTISGETHYRESAGKLLANYAEMMRNNPFGFGRMLSAQLYHFSDSRRVVLSGGESGGFLEVLNREFSPLTVLAPGGGADGESKAAVCGEGYCLPPVDEPEDLRELLN